MPRFQLVDKMSTSCLTAKNSDRFCENELVGVRWYGRVYFHKKRITAVFLDGTLPFTIKIQNSDFFYFPVLDMRGLTNLSAVRKRG